ncbi:hypothetical protein FAES_2269 [Fibrella aestuarina BUZ 2]|uniref:DUF2269 family protein n=1 Tax=Fibrella aestuarina BUZ 2 TaxID=1166018 RepID=I0K825_9BACT|nr:DUF2214 family protein [Fibrella aestuarina]CCH00278.1 hypothetical protein FAES_2269 [Fibrella aestuarina BUZ 2]
MDAFTLRQVLLVLHLSGLVIMAGTTITEWVVFRSFLGLLTKQDKAALSLFSLLSGLGRLLLVGGGILLLSGIGLTILSEGVYLQQLWLQVKLGLILLLPLNGLLVGSPQMKQIRNSLLSEGISLPVAIQPAVTKLTWFHSSQLLVFFTIIILAVFRFI